MAQADDMGTLFGRPIVGSADSATPMPRGDIVFGPLSAYHSTVTTTVALPRGYTPRVGDVWVVAMDGKEYRHQVIEVSASEIRLEWLPDPL